jgi:hypothetical protein
VNANRLPASGASTAAAERLLDVVADDTEPADEVGAVDVVDPPVALDGSVAVPDVEVPGVDVPEVDVPGVDVPGVDVPGVDVPEVDVPGVDVPEVDVPEVDVPEVDVPEVDVREVDVPEGDVGDGEGVPGSPGEWVGRTGSCPPGFGTGLAACAVAALSTTALTVGTLHAATPTPARRACRRFMMIRSGPASTLVTVGLRFLTPTARQHPRGVGEP